MNDRERFRFALERIARISQQPTLADNAASEILRIAKAALQDAQSSVSDNPELTELLIQKLKKKAMTTTEKLKQWNPQQCSIDELLELRAAARALGAEYAAHSLEPPQWLPKAESSLDEEIGLRSHGIRLRALGELKKEREALQAVEARKRGLDQKIASFEASLA